MYIPPLAHLLRFCGFGTRILRYGNKPWQCSKLQVHVSEYTEHNGCVSLPGWVHCCCDGNLVPSVADHSSLGSCKRPGVLAEADCSGDMGIDLRYH